MPNFVAIITLTTKTQEMNRETSFTNHLLELMGIEGPMEKPITACILVIVTCLGLWLLATLLRRICEPIINKLTKRSSANWDDIVFRHKTLQWVWNIIVSVIAYRALPAALAEYPAWANGSRVLVQVLLIISFTMLARETIKSIFVLIADRENLEKIATQLHRAAEDGHKMEYKPSHSLKGLEQMISILLICGAVILIISVLFGKDPLIIFSGLGAAAAVLMLVFQDSILGVVAGVQITANDMLQPGDWITVPKYDANGTVLEVTLATVKIQNWDNTIVTIPPYKLISEGFQNWRGMQDSKGRRVTRSLYIDVDSVRIATAEETEAWRNEPWGATLPEGEIVNLTALRRYLEHYITTIPTFEPTMLYMVRELAPTPQGIPLEVYFFTSCIEWKAYEHVQADALDTVIARIPSFGLRLYQAPASYSFAH